MSHSMHNKFKWLISFMSTLQKYMCCFFARITFLTCNKNISNKTKIQFLKNISVDDRICIYIMCILYLSTVVYTFRLYIIMNDLYCCFSVSHTVWNILKYKLLSRFKFDYLEVCCVKDQVLRVLNLNCYCFYKLQIHDTTICKKYFRCLKWRHLCQ